MTPPSRRIFAVLGNPVAHSLSPRFQNAAFRAMGLDAMYVALQVGEQALAPLMATLAANGGGGNVTLPWKATAAAAAGRRSARVERLGVANVFAGGDNGELVVDNTDVDGLLAMVGLVAPGARDWCVLGTGGSARATAGAALESGARLAVRSRDPARGAAFLRWATSIGVAPAEPAACTVVINATPLGLGADDGPPVAPGVLPAVSAAIDLTYRPTGTTRWVNECRALGLAAVDGREMLLAQGAASWRSWFPGIDPPIDVMRVALDGPPG